MGSHNALAGRGSGTPEGSPMPGSRRRDLSSSRTAVTRRSRGHQQQFAGDTDLLGAELTGSAGDLGDDAIRLRNFSLTPKG